MISAFPCGQHSRDNEFWELQEPGGLIQSLQAKTPFCLGTKNSATTAGATTVLDSCTAASSAFTVGFTNTSGTGGTIVQKASGLCLTMADVSHNDASADAFASPPCVCFRLELTLRYRIVLRPQHRRTTARATSL